MKVSMRSLSGAAFCALFALTSSCTLPFARQGPSTIIKRAESFTVRWSKPDLPPSSARTIGGYMVYARETSDSRWIFLGRTESYADTSFRVNASMLPIGRYEIAVSTYTDSGALSELHRSTDSDATPMAGWIIDWIPSK